MTRFVTLASGFGWHVRDLQRAAVRIDVDLQVKLFSRVTGRLDDNGQSQWVDDLDLGRSNGVLVRMMPPGSLDQVVFRMDILQRVEASGVPVWNPPRVIEAAVDKYLASARLAAAGLRVPPTWVGESARDALAAFQTLGGDVVVKPLFGSEGRGMVRVSDPEIAGRVFRALERVGAVLYVQRFIPNEGRDYRVFILDGRALGTIRRRAAPGEWRTNVALGGTAERCATTTELEFLALRAAQAVGAKLAGVDLLPDLEGRFNVLETNAVPGWRAFSKVTGIDVATNILEALRSARR